MGMDGGGAAAAWHGAAAAWHGEGLSFPPPLVAPGLPRMGVSSSSLVFAWWVFPPASWLSQLMGGFTPLFPVSLPRKEEPYVGSSSERSERVVAFQSWPLMGVVFGKGPGCRQCTRSRGKRHWAERGR